MLRFIKIARGYLKLKWDLENVKHFALFAWLLAKSNSLEVEEDSFYVKFSGDSGRGVKFCVEIVKNFLFGKLTYAGFPVETIPVDDATIRVCDSDVFGTCDRLNYREFSRSKLMDAYKTRWDLAEPTARRIFLWVWFRFLSAVSVNWGFRRFHYNVLFWVVLRRVRRAFWDLVESWRGSTDLVDPLCGECNFLAKKGVDVYTINSYHSGEIGFEDLPDWVQVWLYSYIHRKPYFSDD